jgi:hypothetical protein
MDAAPSNLLLAREGSDLSSAALEERLAAVIAAYDSQGDHRSGTDVDHASAEWLIGCVRQAGVEAALEPFALDRIDPQSCYLRVAGRYIGGVPVFDAAFTGVEGVQGRLGPLGSDAEIGLAETEPFTLMEPQKEQSHVVAAARQGRHKAVVLLTRVLADSKPARDCLFVACSGHELGFLGIDAYLEGRGDLTKRAHRWIHFGANIGSPRQPSLIHASDDAAECWAVAVLETEGLTAGAKASRGSVPRGEAGAMHRGGGRYVALVCGTEVFHHPADRWPDAVDLALLARYARAFANGALQLAGPSG